MAPSTDGRGRRVLLLCLHNHQPVGNFDAVVEAACRDAYLPFLEALESFPEIRVTIHYSGGLLAWIEARRPDVFRRLKGLAARGQVEILGGGMYEPVLALIPERDRQGQIRTMAEHVARSFGRKPRGIWLAERVWEPELAATLASAGVGYLPLDDYHFVRAGLAPEELDGLWLTEFNGSAVRLLPGSERLRYLIPFGGVDEALDAVARMTARDVPYPAAVFADDGEKFGVWPGTRQSVHGDGWLRRFFEGIRARKDVLTTMTFGEYADVAPLRGRVYIPSCSYIEMGEWTLPPSRAAQFGDLLRDFRAGRHGWVRPFAQGGHFRSFLAKYEESNQLHKRMLWVSGRVEEASRRAGSVEGRDPLYRAQCNDVYWHGVFGGLYLNHLREAAWSGLLDAEAAADRVLHAGQAAWTEVVRGDLDCDGGMEILVKTPEMTLLAHAHDGGALTEISLPPRGLALGHVLTRREEGYHQRLRGSGGGGGGTASIHDALALKDPGVLSALAVDTRPRASFREDLYREADAPVAVLDRTAVPLDGTAEREARVEVSRDGPRVDLSLAVALSPGGLDLSLEKVMTVAAGAEGVGVKYRLANRSRESFRGTLSSEWNFNFLSGEGPDRRYEGLGDRHAALSSRGIAEGVSLFRIVDGWRKIALEFRSDRPVVLLREPIETASLSEAGVEKIHQGICLRILFPVRLGPGEYEYYSIVWSIDPVAS